MPAFIIIISALAAAAAIHGCGCGSAIAADLVIPPASNARTPPASPAAGPGQDGLHGADAACLEWTDGCRVCARAEDNKFACSNVGIACTATEGRCTRR